MKTKYGKLDPDRPRKSQNRLSMVRWPVGEEPYPDVPGTDKADPWVNVKLDVVEHPDLGPNQRGLLRGGPELRMRCERCDFPLHIAAEKDGIALLEEAGFKFRPDADRSKSQKVVAAVCPNGHVVQLWGDIALRLIKKED